jgi:sarcosine oxidase / L-pipecolate oxidase
MGMTPDGILKFNCDISFTNMGVHPITQEAMSIPPVLRGETTWTSGTFPKVLKERSQKVLKGSYGRLVDGLEINEYRMCWHVHLHSSAKCESGMSWLTRLPRDATTPTHDFLICPHPHCTNLYIASGGSFHGWKFLPVIGRYIVRMLGGKLDGPMAKRWAWDKDPDDVRPANPTYQIEGDLQDLQDRD